MRQFRRILSQEDIDQLLHILDAERTTLTTRQKAKLIFVLEAIQGNPKRSTEKPSRKREKPWIPKPVKDRFWFVIGLITLVSGILFLLSWVLQ